MGHKRLATYAVAIVAIAAVLAIAGVPLATLAPAAFLLVCPLMMVFMMLAMRSMHGGSQDHVGHGRQQDPTRNTQPPASRPQ